MTDTSFDADEFMREHDWAKWSDCREMVEGAYEQGRTSAAAEIDRLRAQVAEMRENAERGQWLIDWISRNGLLQAHHCYPAEGEQRGDWWLMYPPRVIDRTAPPIGYGKTEAAAIDRARKSETGA